MNRIVFHFLCSAFVLAGCSEAPLIVDTVDTDFNAPISMAFVPGTSLAVVTNGNVSLGNTQGSIVAVDLDARQVLSDTLTPTRSFAGELMFDPARSRLLIADRGDNALLVYDYVVPGTNGAAISFSEVPVGNPQKNTPNGVRTDKEPFGLIQASSTVRGDVVYVTNGETGSVSVVDLDDLSPFDFNPENGDNNGIPLISAANFQQKDHNPSPGGGANRLVQFPNQRLAMVSTTRSNHLFILNLHNQTVQAMIDLSTIAAGGDTRGIAISTSGLAYVAHRGLEGVIVLDVSGIAEENNSLRVIDPVLVDIILTGTDPDGVILSTDEKRLFVANTRDNKISMIDVEARRVTGETLLAGRVPGELFLDSTRSVFYAPNLLSNDIAVLDETTGALVGSIE